MEETFNYSIYYNDSNLENTTFYAKLNWTAVFRNINKTSLYDPPTHIVVLLYIFYGTICLTALVGNLIVLWLVLGSKRMWTVTNMFICNLALSDVIMAIFIVPFHFQAALFQRWDLPNFMCAVCPSVQIWSVTITGFTLSIIALHRQRAFVAPLRAPISKKKAAWSLLMVWVVGGFIALPTGFDYTIINYRRDNGLLTFYCENILLPDTFRLYYNRFVVIVQYFIPLVIITIAYVRIGWILWKNKTPGNGERLRDATLLRRKKKVTKMLIVVVVMFGLCWLPFQLYNFLLTFFPSINEFTYINMVWFMAHWLAMSNSCCNPFIYGIYNERFKDEFLARVDRLSCKLRRTTQVRIELV